MELAGFLMLIFTCLLAALVGFVWDEASIKKKPPMRIEMCDAPPSIDGVAHYRSLSFFPGEDRYCRLLDAWGSWRKVKFGQGGFRVIEIDAGKADDVLFTGKDEIIQVWSCFANFFPEYAPEVFSLAFLDIEMMSIAESATSVSAG